jgi:hypothetical protein
MGEAKIIRPEAFKILRPRRFLNLIGRPIKEVRQRAIDRGFELGSYTKDCALNRDLSLRSKIGEWGPGEYFYCAAEEDMYKETRFGRDTTFIGHTVDDWATWPGGWARLVIKE